MHVGTHAIELGYPASARGPVTVGFRAEDLRSVEIGEEALVFRVDCVEKLGAKRLVHGMVEDQVLREAPLADELAITISTERLNFSRRNGKRLDRKAAGAAPARRETVNPEPIVIEETVSTLAIPSQQCRDDVARMERSIATHDAAMADVAAMNRIEVGGIAASDGPLAFPFTVAAWNLERCLFPQESAGHLRAAGASLVMLSEMDNGMARTGQRHTTADVATMLGMQYAYGIEFLELGLGSDTERDFCKDDANEKGFHGNALLTSVPLRRPFLERLWGERLWFTDTDQPRLGERIAVGAVIETEAGPFVAVSTHLESATTAAYRERQVKELVERLDAAFPALPMLIGGDLNTGNHIGGDFEAEGLFAMSAARGFTRHGGPIDQMTTRPSLITRWPKRAMKLDWFLARGMRIGESRIIPSLDASGRPLSDHDLITCVVEGFE
ncbi:hypothetical protein SJ05684_c36760 [Sinorhizobium sojae CCBAU 05684]|uniref:Endonuclease n=1 Tax=Sinorhizobium sojae CCBAU 05684 TaxID=716928 RepID=A0A249PIE7_9HYPH|nr:endonuclease [Sinorhizobium sojae]ASY65089.1 hypothetical protein SJ05684_c36760 [Sinorhizobium sojae CCBAU 05684]